MIASIIRTIFAQPGRERIEKQFREVTTMLARSDPKVAAMLVDAQPDLLAFAAFPRRHWYQIWSTNPLERVNKEIKRHHSAGRDHFGRRSFVCIETHCRERKCHEEAECVYFGYAPDGRQIAALQLCQTTFVASFLDTCRSGSLSRSDTTRSGVDQEATSATEGYPRSLAWIRSQGAVGCRSFGGSDTDRDIVDRRFV